MTSSTLETLGLSAATVRRIRDLGVDSAEGLRSLVDAAPLDLERHLGEQAMRGVRHALGDTPLSSRHGFDPDAVTLGVQPGRAPRLATDTPSIDLRDRLFERPQRLRATGAGADDAEVAALECRLNELLDNDR